MRLTEKEIEVIISRTRLYFGSSARAWLFGSRTNDEKKGGDIDLFIKSEEPERLTLENRLRFSVDLKLSLGDQRIDVVLDTPALQLQEVFYQTIQETALKL